MPAYETQVHGKTCFYMVFVTNMKHYFRKIPISSENYPLCTFCSEKPELQKPPVKSQNSLWLKSGLYLQLALSNPTFELFFLL